MTVPSTDIVVDEQTAADPWPEDVRVIPANRFASTCCAAIPRIPPVSTPPMHGDQVAVRAGRTIVWQAPAR